MLLLQRAAGNRAVAELMAKRGRREPVVQREVRWAEGRRTKNINLGDSVTKFVDFGVTPANVNAHEFPGGKAEAAVAPPDFSFASSLVGTKLTVRSPPLNVVGYRMELPTAPPWTGTMESAKVHDKINAQANADFDELAPYTDRAGTTTVHVHGLPNDAGFADLVETHENHHVEDVRGTKQRRLDPWDHRIQEFGAEGRSIWGISEESAKTKFYREVGGTPAEMGTAYKNELGELGRAFHKTGPGGSPKVARVTTVPDCSALTVYLRHPMG